MFLQIQYVYFDQTKGGYFFNGGQFSISSLNVISMSGLYKYEIFAPTEDEYIYGKSFICRP